MSEEKVNYEDKKLVVHVSPVKLKEELSFSDNDLSSEMMKQAPRYAYYANQSAQATRQYDDLKIRAEILESLVDKQIRDRKKLKGEKTTEAEIAKAIQRNPRMIKMRLKLNEAKAMAEVAKQSLEALRHKRDMLVQIGVTQREERKGELRVSEKNASRENAMEVVRKNNSNKS